jgi:hypothetical protein
MILKSERKTYSLAGVIYNLIRSEKSIAKNWLYLGEHGVLRSYSCTGVGGRCIAGG